MKSNLITCRLDDDTKKRLDFINDNLVLMNQSKAIETAINFTYNELKRYMMERGDLIEEEIGSK